MSTFHVNILLPPAEWVMSTFNVNILLPHDRVGDVDYVLSHNVYVAAFGKAVVGMVRALEDLLGDHIVEGVASVRYGIIDALKSNGIYIRFSSTYKFPSIIRCAAAFSNHPPPPTAQTEHAGDLKFYMVGPQGTRF